MFIPRRRSSFPVGSLRCVNECPAIDSGGCVMDSFRAVTAARLNASQRRRVGVGMNISARDDG